MVDVQLENGYCSLATELVDQFCRYRLSGEEWLVLWAIFRKTYCWHKKEDKIALSTFAGMTGLKRPTVLRALQKLSSKKIIDIIKKDDRQPNTYRFNKHFDTWLSLSKKDTLSSKKIMPVINKDNELSSKKRHSIDIKDTIQKIGRFTPPSLSEVGEYISIMGYSVDAEAWCAFYESNGWKVGKNKMVSWKGAVATWAKRNEPKLNEYQKAIKVLSVIKYGTPVYSKKVWRGIDLAAIKVALDSFYPDQIDLLPNGTATVLSNIDEIKKHLN